MEHLESTTGAVEHIEKMARKPFLIDENEHGALVAIPNGYSLERRTDHLAAPGRKIGTTTLHDVESFIAQVKRHGSLSDCVVYVDADYAKQRVQAVAVFNDHGEDMPGFRDHRAVFTPRFTE